LYREENLLALLAEIRKTGDSMNGIFRISGGKKLSGSVEISGSKNAALPTLAACLALPDVSSVENVPDILDVKKFFSLIEGFGGKISQREENMVEVDAKNIRFSGEILDRSIYMMRASVLLLAPLLLRFGEVKMPFPGGCVLGKRSFDAHLRVFSALGAEVVDSEKCLHLRLPQKKFLPGVVILPEMSVTATENALIAAAFSDGMTEIRLAAAEPHVQSLCHFLTSTGAHIEGIGTHFLKVHGTSRPCGGKGSVVSDYLEVGTFLLAGILTDSNITLKNVVPSHLDSFFEKLFQVGARFEIYEKESIIETFPRKKEFQFINIQTGVFPGFPTDLHPQFGVLMTQALGTSKIFETLFERKFAYLLELEKLGAGVNILNPHEFLIHGPKKLKGAPVASQDIRAGAAMILAALIADGETEISNIHYLDRGYFNLENKFRMLGANILREEKS
jgi:UDP-N-acetylglucosamine 1-carboxyvinyltransferase